MPASIGARRSLRLPRVAGRGLWRNARWRLSRPPAVPCWIAPRDIDAGRELHAGHPRGARRGAGDRARLLLGHQRVPARRPASWRSRSAPAGRSSRSGSSRSSPRRRCATSSAPRSGSTSPAPATTGRRRWSGRYDAPSARTPARLPVVRRRPASPPRADARTHQRGRPPRRPRGRGLVAAVASPWRDHRPDGDDDPKDDGGGRHRSQDQSTQHERCSRRPRHHTGQRPSSRPRARRLGDRRQRRRARHLLGLEQRAGRPQCPVPTGRAGMATVFPDLTSACTQVDSPIEGKAEVYECLHDGFVVRLHAMGRGVRQGALLRGREPGGQPAMGDLGGGGRTAVVLHRRATPPRSSRTSGRRRTTACRSRSASRVRPRPTAAPA